MTGLVREVTLSNISQSTLQLEILDGLPIVIPYGISNLGLKEISRTLEAWMAVFNLESGIPFYLLHTRLRNLEQKFNPGISI